MLLSPPLLVNWRRCGRAPTCPGWRRMMMLFSFLKKVLTEALRNHLMITLCPGTKIDYSAPLDSCSQTMIFASVAAYLEKLLLSCFRCSLPANSLPRLPFTLRYFLFFAALCPRSLLPLLLFALACCLSPPPPVSHSWIPASSCFEPSHSFKKTSFTAPDLLRCASLRFAALRNGSPLRGSISIG